MSLADAARSINATAYGYVSSWTLLTACDLHLFDRLPARADQLDDVSSDAALVETMLHVLAEEGLVSVSDGGVWSQTDDMTTLLAGESSYRDYLGGQILHQMAPRLTLGPTGDNVLAAVLANPGSRRGYEGWFADEDEAHAYQESQFAGSLGPAKSIARSLPAVRGRVLDLGGGWGAVAQAIAREHDVDVDVVDLESVVEAAPAAAERVQFLAGNALDPATWPTDIAGVSYDGVVLSYLFSSIPGDDHEPLIAALAERGLRWIAVHGFMIGSGAHAAAWSLQHAVFVPGHASRSADDVAGMLTRHGYEIAVQQPLVDEMTSLIVGTRPT